MTTLAEGHAETPSIVIRGLRKRYGDTVALAGLDLVVPMGSIVGVAGPNGAGKSTLVRILAGELSADSGEILIDGKPWTSEFGATDVAVVHQEPQLFPNLTVLENLLVGREGTHARRPRATDVERQLLRRFGIDAYADRTLRTLPISVQQRVEITRALVHGARLVLFDEPNSALTDEGSIELFQTMHELSASGHAVILVSHRLGELVVHASEVAVITDGMCSMVLSGPELTEEHVARAMTITGGRSSSTGASRHRNEPVGLAVEDWRHRGGMFGPVALKAHIGEIVAIAGVEGSGGREFVRSLAGFEPAEGLIWDSDASTNRVEWQRTGYVPPDRRAALFFNLSVGNNLVSRLGDSIRAPFGMRSERRSRALAIEWIERMRVKTAGVSAWIGSLSGGNQQKVLIAAAMAPGPQLLVLEEPTRGVDIGSKRDIYSFLHEYANDGKVVVLYCTEIQEVFEVADLLHVMAGGRLSPPLHVTEFTDEQALATAVARLERETGTKMTV